MKQAAASETDSPRQIELYYELQYFATAAALRLLVHLCRPLSVVFELPARKGDSSERAPAKDCDEDALVALGDCDPEKQPVKLVSSRRRLVAD